MLHVEVNLEENGHVQEDERVLLLKRVSNSASFRSSARLREFLLYVGDCALREAPAEATEQQIALHVFRRQPGLNSSEDSIVRTHARLLRQKLAIYFSEEGLHEPVILEVPKGHYLLVFKNREEALPEVRQELGLGVPQARVQEPSVSMARVQEANVQEASQPPSPPPLAAAEPGANGRSQRYLAMVVLCGALVALAVFLTVYWARRGTASTAVEQFWKPFFTGAPPLVIFSNALFQGDAKRGLSYAPPVEKNAGSSSALVDTYTGVGELTAVYTLTRLFDAHQAHFVLKRSQLMTWDDAEVRNLIFIGSTAENPSLKALQSSLDFSIVASPEAAGIENHHPKAEEPAVYWRPEHPLTRDYAIVALVPGVLPGESTLMFSGLTTFGTQAGVEFVCRPDTAAELMRRIQGPKGELRPFEAIIETTITGGVPLRARLVTVHVH